MEKIDCFAKYSFCLLLISCVCIKCETKTAQEKDGRQFQDGQEFEDDSTSYVNAETEIHQINEKHVIDLENIQSGDKEKEGDGNADITVGSTAVKEETTRDAEDERNFLKAQDNTDTGEAGDIKLEGIEDGEITENKKDSSTNEQEVTEERSTNSAPAEPSTSKEINDTTQGINSEAFTNKTTVETNSTFYQWLKFILDPIIEEFKDGIYPKLLDKTNATAANVSITNENITVAVETANITVAEPTNVTETESNNTTDSGKKVKFQCTGRNITDNVNATVNLITTAKLLQLLNFDKNDTENVTDCLLVMFYAPWCHFCAKIAPQYNALARAFPQLDFVAVDTAQFSNLLARFGTVSVPNILVFHQSRAAVKFNQTDRTFENFVTFVTNSTGLEPNITVNVTEADYLGPVPSVPTDQPDYLLLISWIFVIFWSSCMFVKSNKGQQWINRVRILWQEHQHID